MLHLILGVFIVWFVCSIIAFEVIDRHETGIVLSIQLTYNRAHTIEDWGRVKRLLVAGGPLTLVAFATKRI